MVEDIKKFGRIPKRNSGTSEQQRSANSLAERFQRHKKISAEVLEELRTLVDPRDLAMSARLLEEAQEAPHPKEGVADEAEYKLDHELLLLANGHQSRDPQRRVEM